MQDPKPFRPSAVVGMITCALVFGPSACGQDAPPPDPPANPGAPAPAPAAAPPTTPAPPVTPVAHVEVRGSGPTPMVLIPDLGYDWTVFDKFMSRSAEWYPMYAVTLSGMCGTEPPMPRDEDEITDFPLLRNSVAAIARLINERGIAPPVVVGHGMGGHVAMWLALEHPGLVSGVISWNGWPLVPLHDRRFDLAQDERLQLVYRKYLREFQQETLTMWNRRQTQAAPTLVTDPERANQLLQQVLKTDRGVAIMYFLEYMMSDLTGRMNDMSVPMLVLAAVGPEQDITFVEYRRQWEQALGTPPNLWLRYLMHTRHFVMDDNPDEVELAVDAFIGGQPVEGAVTSPTTRPVSLVSRPHGAAPGPKKP